MDVCERVVRSGWFILGPELEKFETEFAVYNNVKHCVGVANGTDAIELALRASGATVGDTIATVANAGFYTTTAVLALNANPLFMDVDPTNQCVTTEEVEKAIDGGSRFIVATHLFGRVIPDIAEIAMLCKEKNVVLVEDCAQAHNAKLAGKNVGSFGDVASFSFYPTKNLGGLGDGGAVVTNASLINVNLRKLRQYGWSDKYKVELQGGRNSRLDEIQAGLLSLLLPDLNRDNDSRRKVADHYKSNIVHPNIITPEYSGENFVSHLYVIRVRERDSLKKHLLNHGIKTDVHYPIPDHQQPIFLNKTNISLPATETLAKEILTLPCYPEIRESQIESVITAVNQWTQ